VKLKKIFLLAISGFILGASNVSTLGVFAKTEEPVTAGDIKKMNVISSEGVFTFYERSTSTCSESWIGEAGDDVKNIAKVSNTYKEAATVEGDDWKATVKNMGPNIINQLIKAWVNEISAFFDLDCGKEGSLGVISQLFVLTKTVNVTLFEGVMKITALVQWIALSLSLLVIVYYGITMSSGIQRTPPMVFAIRMFLALLGVYAAPYLVQDILNINNYIVYNLSQVKINVSGESVPAEYAFPIALGTMFQGLFELSVHGIAVVLLVLIAVVASLIPLLKLVLWWYIRWFKILIYTVISPVMFLTIALEETSNTAKGYVKGLVRDVFSQTFVLIGIMMVASLLPTLLSMMSTYNLGAVGLAIGLYAMLSFLSQLPDMANNLIDGNASNFGIKALDSWINNGVSKMNRVMPSRIRHWGTNPKNRGRRANPSGSSYQKTEKQGKSSAGNTSGNKSKGKTK
jgi:hypothetical protein